MADKCNHTSVGMLVYQGDDLLLIERAKPPYGYAVPAGHVDDNEEYLTAAIRELREEVGLNTEDLELVTEGRKENPCRREDGIWHYWKIYKVEVTGELERSESETKQAGWFTPEQVQELGNRTQAYQAGEIDEEEWQTNPGLEEVMYDWFKDMNIIRYNDTQEHEDIRLR